MRPPTIRQFVRGYRAYQRHQPRDAMYKVATFLIQHFWGKPAETADSLGVLLFTWNQVFYRFGAFDYRRLQRAVESSLPTISAFRKRHISDYSKLDDKSIRSLFLTFNTALQIREGACKGRRSPVSVAKALHLLAPSFFPLWDDRIARAYGCYYSDNAAQCYIRFTRITKNFSDVLLPRLPVEIHPFFPKRFDEYNYARFTKHWI